MLSTLSSAKSVALPFSSHPPATAPIARELTDTTGWVQGEPLTCKMMELLFPSSHHSKETWSHFPVHAAGYEFNARTTVIAMQHRNFQQHRQSCTIITVPCSKEEGCALLPLGHSPRDLLGAISNSSSSRGAIHST